MRKYGKPNSKMLIRTVEGDPITIGSPFSAFRTSFFRFSHFFSAC